MDQTSRHITNTLARTSLLLLALSAPLNTARAEVGQVEIQSIRIGLDGRYKVGHWTPLWVTIRGGADDVRATVEVVAADSDGYPAAFRQSDTSPAVIPAETAVTVERYVKPGRTGGDLTIRLKQDERLLAERTYKSGEIPTPIRSTQPLAVTLGRSIGIAEAVKKRIRERSNPTVCAEIADASGLPRQWFGYEAVDTVAVATSEPSSLEQMDEAQFAAFDQWLKLGGHLILCVGQRGEEVFADGARLARYRPGTQPEVTLQRNTSGLVDFAGATERLDANQGGRVRRFSVPMTVLRDVRGRIENDEIVGAEGRMPTIVRFPHGLGQIVFVAFDLDQEPFTDWQGRDGMVARILQGNAVDRNKESDGDESLGQVAHLGFKDLAGQLRASLDQFEGVTRVEFSWVAALIGLYVLLIGPADYFLLHRLRRQHWTWVTFPAVVILFGVIAWLFQGWLTGNRLHVNQVDVVDLDWETQTLRGDTWIHVYSPVSQQFELSLSPKDWILRHGDIQSQLFAWQGLPGDGLGGVDAESNAPVAAREYGVTYAAADAAIGRLPIRVSSSKSLAARWTMDFEIQKSAPPPNLSVGPNGLLVGRVVNPLDVELRDCLILYENWAFAIPGSLRPGGAITVDSLDPRNLEWRLTRRKVVDTRDVSTPWEQSSFDVPRIIENMMFHKAAGGDGYTGGLTHRYHPYLDLTDHLRSGRAVLVGRSEQAVMDLQRNGRSLDEFRDRQWMIYRVVFPVDNSGEAGSRD